MPPPVPRENPNSQCVTQDFIASQSSNSKVSYCIFLNKIFAITLAKKNVTLQAVEVVKKRSVSEHVISQPAAKRSYFDVVHVFQEQNSLSVLQGSGDVSKQQKYEFAKREQEIRAMKAQNEARRLEIEARRQENEAKHQEFMQNLFYD